MIYILGNGSPVRLFAAGLHGEEWKDTSCLLEQILCMGKELKIPNSGTLALLPRVSTGKYLSTLDRRYYSGPGKLLLSALKYLRPEIYIEVHSYSKKNFENLTGKARIKRRGVPAFSVLKEGVLLGSVSPFIRQYFPKEALCLTFEVEKENLASKQFALHFLTLIGEMQSKAEFLEFLKKDFPKQAEKAIEDYRRFYGEL
ncbi:MAG: DUF2119 domain-containing protein [Methanosarcinaceae archaeon]|nr:DUF2119 domain-containing protein [Methanosarcinaceae archaeon]